MTVLRDQLLIFGLAAALAAAGAVPVIDHMTHTVLGIVEPIAWTEVWRPYWNPPPMNVGGVRPGSVMLMKLLALAFPGDQLPRPWLHAPLAALQLWVFGAGAWAWLRRQGLQDVALPSALACLVLSPTLFSAWFLPELDALGAGLTLGGLALLGRPGPLQWRWAPCLALLASGVFLKESSGLLALALLSSGAAAAGARGQRDRALRFAVGAGLTGLGWLAVALPLLGDTSSAMAGTSPLDRMGVIEHNAVQLVSLVGSAGVGLLALGALRARAAWVAPAVVLGLLLLPELRVYNHYEAVYATQRWVAVVLAAALALALAARLRETGRDGRAAVALAPLAIYAVITAASLVLSTAREDMAARILLAAAPALFGLAFDAARQAWVPATASTRAALAVLVAACGWGAVSEGANAVVDWRARNAVDVAGRTALLPHLEPGGVVVFNHYWMWLGAAELRAAGATENDLAGATLALSPTLLEQPTLPTVDWGEGPVDLDEAWRSGRPTTVYWLSALSELPAAQRSRLIGDLSWTRRPLGLFTPLRAEGGPGGPLPTHNLPEDLHRTEWELGADGAEQAPLLALALGHATNPAPAIRQPAPRVAEDLLDLPRRAWHGIPLVEPRRWEAHVLPLRPVE